MLETTSSTRLAGVLDGFPRHLLPPHAFDRIARLTLDLDALGRLEAGTGSPLVEPHTLRATLRELVSPPLADRLVDLLAGLPGAALARTIHPPATEVPWFELADRVVIFDPDPSATFGELMLPARTPTPGVVTAVHRRFPSLEPELLEPGELPPRLRALLEGDDLETVLRTIVRQLGWWSALAAVLLVPAAVGADPAGGEEGDGRLANLWPLSMYVAAAAVGGWTLTVVGSCILAPLD